MIRSNWRDCLAWKTEGLDFSSTSNEVCKLYDASISQIVGYYNDPLLGGLEKTIPNLIEADPNFSLGHVIDAVSQYFGNCLSKTKREEKINLLQSLKPYANEREVKHISAAIFILNDNFSNALFTYKEILFSYPTDMLAVILSFTLFLYNGAYAKMRDLLSWVLPKWDRSIPLYSHLYGLYAFSLEETNYFQRAEVFASQALSMNPLDSWATHTLSHIYDSTGRHQEAIDYLNKTEKDWTFGENLQVHNYWHLGLFQLEQNQLADALSTYDNHIFVPNSKTATAFNISDEIAFLVRLKFRGVNITDRLQAIKLQINNRLDAHDILFYDTHYLLAYCANQDTNDLDIAKQFAQNCILETENSLTYGKAMKEVGTTLFEAILAYGNKNYSETVCHLDSIRYDLQQIGGSHAQRDLFNLLLINAAASSNSPNVQKIAKNLMLERVGVRQNSPFLATLKKQIDSM